MKLTVFPLASWYSRTVGSGTEHRALEEFRVGDPLRRVLVQLSQDDFAIDGFLGCRNRRGLRKSCGSPPWWHRFTSGRSLLVVLAAVNNGRDASELGVGKSNDVAWDTGRTSL